MKFAVLAVHIMKVIRRNEADIVFMREFHEVGIGLALFRQAVVLNFEEEIIPAKDIEILPHEGIGALCIVLQDGARNLTGDAGRQADEALVIFLQKFLIDARLVVHAFNIGKGYELYEIAVACLIFREQNQMIIAHTVNFAMFLTRPRRDIHLAADDGLYALFLCFFIKINDAVHRAVIGDGNAVHAELFGRRNQILDATCTVK